MKTTMSGCMALAAASVNAQVGELYDAKLTLREDINDPAIAASAVNGSWLAQRDNDATVSALAQMLSD